MRSSCILLPPAVAAVASIYGKQFMASGYAEDATLQLRGLKQSEDHRDKDHLDENKTNTNIKEAYMKFQRKYYGDDVLIEMEEVNEESYRTVLGYLPAEERHKVIGYRKVAKLTNPEITEEGGD